MRLRLGSRRAAHQPSPVALNGHKLSEFRVGELAQLCRRERPRRAQGLAEDRGAHALHVRRASCGFVISSRRPQRGLIGGRVEGDLKAERGVQEHGTHH